METLPLNSFILGFILLLLSSAKCLELYEVSTSLGNITGSIESAVIVGADDNFTTLKCVQYLGIPYAQPPVGDLRFRKPVPKRPWSGSHNGTVYGPMCHQGAGQEPGGTVSIVGVTMSEDCLTLDIYAPVATTEGKGPFAVMVILYGNMWTSKGYIGDVLSAYGYVVVVVVNHRTQLMGFFSTGDSSAPGNYGLWDQMMAIHWVKDHISNFGGDPDNIALVGHSVGGSYAILQALNPSNKGIIKRVIALAGTPIPTYKTSSFLREPTGSDFITSVGCKRDTSIETVDCLRRKSLEDINDALGSLSYKIAFTPVVDGDFLREEPQKMLLSNDSSFLSSMDSFGSVDLMIGLANKEGGAHIAYMWTELLNQDIETFQINRTEFQDTVVPTSMDIVFGDNIPDAIIQNVVFQYIDQADPDNFMKIRDSVVDLSTDIDVAAPVLKTANFHDTISTKKTYLYQFSADLSIGTFSKSMPSWINGANNADDLNYLFGFGQRNMDAWTHTKGFVPTAAELRLSEKWRTLITNFAKSGDPGDPVILQNIPEWPTYEENSSPYLDISHDQISTNQHFREPYMTFWIKIIPSLLQMNEVRWDESTCDVNCNIKKEKGHIFGVNMHVAENIILALCIISGCLLLTILLLIALSVARENTADYNFK